MGPNFVDKKILVVLGPTSIGKTDIALYLANKFNGELISCDSRQVYTGLDIGTGKLPGKNSKFEIRNSKLLKHNGRWIVNGVNIWMYDVVSPKKQYSVADYVTDARKVIRDIAMRDKLPIVVGGTGLYLKALLEGLPNLAVSVDLALRKKLQKLSKEKLQERLQTVSMKRWEKMNQSDRGNSRRLIRAIELSTLPIMGRSPRSLSLARDDTVKIGLIAPRKVLYKRADERVVNRINQGMIDEAEKLHKNGLSFKRMKQLGLEYGVLVDFLSGKIKNEDELVKVMQNKIHGYIRRQLTWFKKEEGIFWFNITNKNFPDNVEKVVVKWYYHPNDTKDRYFS